MSKMKKKKKSGVTEFVPEVKHAENYPNFEKSVNIIQNDLQGFIAKILTVSQQRQTILAIFCRRGSVA